MNDKKNKNLPTLQQEIQTAILKEGTDTKKLLMAQGFTGLLNKKVEENKLKPHPIAKNMQYLPISFMEMTLDELFFGQWSTSNFNYSVIANEIVGDITLTVTNPVTNEKITRVGADAITIMVDSVPNEIKYNSEDPKTIQAEKQIKRNQWALNKDNKKPAALSSGGFASLKAQCFKNACVSLGKYFGRDANRKFFDNFDGIVKASAVKIRELQIELSKAVSLCQDVEFAESVRHEINDAEADGANTPELYKKLINSFKK